MNFVYALFFHRFESRRDYALLEKKPRNER